MTESQRSLGAIEAFGCSISITAPTLAVAYTTILATQSAGRAAPLAYLIGGIVVALVGLSFVAFSRRIAHAGSAYAYVGSVIGRRFGFLAGWALLLMYVTFLAGSTALVGNFGAAALSHVGINRPDSWLVIAATAALTSIWITQRDTRIAARVTLALEGASVLAILFLSVVVLTRVRLSLLPFWPDRRHGWGGVGYGIVFAVLSFSGFEGAATLGEEARAPGRSIPNAILVTVIATTLFYVVVSYAEIVAYGPGNAQALADASAPLDELSTRFISGSFASLLDLACATSAFACVIGSLSAAARILFALSRAGLARRLAAADAKHGTPTRPIFIAGVVNLGSLLLWGAYSSPTDYSGDIATIGTLALILVYIGVTGTQAISAFRSRRLGWAMLGTAGTVLLLWPLTNSLYPVPHWPGNLWPYVVTAWLVVGGLADFLRPSAAQFDTDAQKPSADPIEESGIHRHVQV